MNNDVPVVERISAVVVGEVVIEGHSESCGIVGGGADHEAAVGAAADDCPAGVRRGSGSGGSVVVIHRQAEVPVPLHPLQ